MELVGIRNPILAKTSTPLAAEDLEAGKYADLVAEMKKTMVANNGIGLAANQVNRGLALFIIDENLAARYEVPNVYANPEITEYGKERDALEEGCLSIVGFWRPVTRSKKIMFRALDSAGKKVKFRARGMLARVLQHETDHINGITIKNRQ